MKDYSAMSDDEISKEVGNYLGVEWANLDANYHKLCYWKAGAGPMVFDPCNDPAEAWPIIKSNLISLTPYGGDGSWWEAEDRYGNGKSDCDNNPLRAAMVVYLMMKDRCGHCGGDGYVEIKHTEFEIEQHLCHHCNKEE